MAPSSEPGTTTLTIRSVDRQLKQRPRLRAARHGHSMEAELRLVLRETLNEPSARELNLAESIRRRVATLGGVELQPHPAVPVPEPPRLLESNVIPELMRPASNQAVVAWVAAQSRATLYTTSINQAELLYGVAALPAGKRRTALATVAEAIFEEDFAGRILPVESNAAAH